MVPDASRQSHRAVESPSLAEEPSIIDRIDPRVRIIAATVFVGLAAVANRFPTLGTTLAVALLTILLTRLNPAVVLGRILPINLVMLFLVLVLPWTMGRTPLFSVGTFSYTREGLLLAILIALKGNAILLTLIVLLGTLDTTTLGHALSHLRVPDKLIHLLLFTVRYLDVLHREYLRMAAAMKVRAFRPRMNMHTYATYGHLVGMLLVRSLDRSERILAAMKCRGFRGRFFLLDHFAASRRDIWFAVVSSSIAALLVAVEWL
jgi:cobalt/nickel transport system permease protein